MIIMKAALNRIYGFSNFCICFSYPKKIVNSLIENEHLAGRPYFRYKKVVLLMGANATGKTAFGKALSDIFRYLNTGDAEPLLQTVQPGAVGEFSVDFVNGQNVLYRVQGTVHLPSGAVELRYGQTGIGAKDTYEKCAHRLEKSNLSATDVKTLGQTVGKLHYKFSCPESADGFEGDGKTLLHTLKAIIGTLDPSLTDLSERMEEQNAFTIYRGKTEFVIRDGKLLNREGLSNGVANGVDIASFLAFILTEREYLYYCDGLFSHVHSDLEKRIFGIMVAHLLENEQLIFTTHNTDMLDLNLPKHSFAFLRKSREDGETNVMVAFASDILKRNTDSIRCAYENDMFASLPDETLLVSLDGYAEIGALCFPAIYDLTNPSSAKRLVRALSASSHQKVPSVQNDSVPVSKEEALNILRKLKK